MARHVEEGHSSLIGLVSAVPKVTRAELTRRLSISRAEVCVSRTLPALDQAASVIDTRKRRLVTRKDVRFWREAAIYRTRDRELPLGGRPAAPTSCEQFAVFCSLFRVGRRTGAPVTSFRRPFLVADMRPSPEDLGKTATALDCAGS